MLLTYVLMVKVKLNCVLHEIAVYVHELTYFSDYLIKEQELETLKRKSPSDLWKEDLAAFIEELEVCSL